MKSKCASVLLVLAGVATAWALQASAAPFATLRWTNPRFNAAVDDSGLPYCEIGRDSCRNLWTIEVWGQPTTGGPARLVKEVPVFGRAGLPESTVVDRTASWMGWHYWVFPKNQSGRRAPCPSNVVLVAGSVTTGVGDPSPLIVADELWFDVRGRRLPGRPTTSGVYFLVWRVRGKLQKPASKVTFVDGRPVNLPLPRWALER